MEQDFDELYRTTYLSVLRTVVLLTTSVEDAHDVTQKAFSRALARWSVVRRTDRPHEWVRRVAVNAALDLGRRATTRRGLLRRLSSRPQEVAPPDGTSVDVVRALQQLRPAQRQAVVLYYLCDLDVAAIARQTQTSASTVTTHLARGRAALARLLRTEEVALDV